MRGHRSIGGRIAYCSECSSPVVDTADGWRGHRERVHGVVVVVRAAEPAEPVRSVEPVPEVAPILLPPPPPARSWNIYQRAYREFRAIIADNLVDKGDRAVVMAMLVAQEVGFDLERTIVESHQPRPVVEQVYRNMRASKLWREFVLGEGTKWGFQHGHRPDDPEDIKLLAVEFVLHVLVAKGEVVYVPGGKDE